MVRQCRLIKDSEKKVITTFIEKAIQGWITKWCVSEFEFEVAFTEGNCSSINEENESEEIWSIKNDSEWIVLLGTQDFQTRFSSLVFYGDPGAANDEYMGTLQREVTKEAIAELIGHCIPSKFDDQSWAHSQLNSGTQGIVDNAPSWSGITSVSIRLSKLKFDLLLSRELIEAISPTVRGTALRKITPISEYVSAFGAQEMTAVTRMAPLMLSIGALENLSSGDVVLLNHKLNQPLTLDIKSTNIGITGYVGKRGNRLAIQLSDISNAGK